MEIRKINKKNIKKYNLKIFIICIFLVFSIAFFGSFFTTESVNSDWYLENKPNFTPPNWIFGPVWTFLYFLIAVSLYLVWISSKREDKKIIGFVYGINLVLNGLWSYFFFGLKNPVLGLVNLIFIWITIWTMIYINWRIDKKAAWLLVPYLIWVSFAGILNAAFF